MTTLEKLLMMLGAGVVQRQRPEWTAADEDTMVTLLALYEGLTDGSIRSEFADALMDRLKGVEKEGHDHAHRIVEGMSLN